MIHYSLENGIATLTLDQPESSVNLINPGFITALSENLDSAIADTAVKGIIIASAKKDFMVGGDLRGIYSFHKPEQVIKLGSALHAVFRKMETSGKPVVAAITGSAIGGGYEVCLACHHRVCLNDNTIQIGLPEVQVGLLPGGGGTQRLPRLIGIQPSLQPLIEGRKYRPAKALEMRMVSELKDSKEEVLAAAKAWIAANPTAQQPWDGDKYRIPGGDLHHPKHTQLFAGTAGVVIEKTYHNYPAPINIMNAVYEGLKLPFDRALQVELRYFTYLVLSPEAKNLTRSLFLHQVAAKRGEARPAGQPETEVNKVGILGAGMMGAGIAYVSAKAGIEVILKDVSQEAADKGKAYSQKILEKAVTRGKMTPQGAAAILKRINPTADPKDIEGCDLVVEAVFESRELKATVTKESEAVLASDAIFASNTSTLPITGLAEASARPEQFIGLHFFSPVDKMPLVEIILGEKTNDFALAKSIDYILKLKMVPIVVNDSRGFYTSRVFKTFVMEGFEMLREGVKPALIENASKLAGMPVGALAVADEVSIELLYKIIKQNEKDGFEESAVRKEVSTLFIEKLNRPGRKAGKGFYEYPEGGKKFLWPGLAEHFPVAEHQPTVEEVKRRILHSQAIETVRIMEEGVVTKPADADLGSILGWGFPPYTGGAISYIDYVGVAKFVAECDELADKYGDRFRPTDKLREMARTGGRFYPEVGKMEVVK